MSHVAPERKTVPARKAFRKSPHRLGDPGLRQERGGIGWGGLLVGGAGSVFVAYVWNVGGLQTYLDATFGELTRNVHTHDQAVASAYLAALPILGMMLAVIVVYLMLTRAAGRVSKMAKRRRHKRGTVRTAVEARAAGMAVARPAAEFVRPVRLVGARDESILVKTVR